VTRLYLRIYLAVLASLAVFVLVAGFLWNRLAEGGPRAQHAAFVAGQAAAALEGETLGDPVAAIERLAGRLRADLALFDAHGRPLARAGGRLPPPPPDPGDGELVRGRHGAPAWSLRLDDGRLLVARARAPRPPGGGLFGTLLLVALAIAVGAYPVVRRLTRRLERLQQGVVSLGQGDLGTRVPVEGKDEVARLAASFNDSAARIEALVGAHRLLLANASHELRTPLARVRIGLELLAQQDDPARRAAAVGEIAADIAELDQLIDEILLTSRLDAVPQLERREPVDLLALAAEEAARLPDCQVEGVAVTVEGDPTLLRRALRNLLDNALRHGRPPVTVTVATGGDQALLTVADCGPGIPPEAADRIFEPFFRIPGRGAGSGLGLALVRRIARLHGGEATLSAAAGARILLTLPTLPRP
jgi:signal transduction histidine kinase